MLFNLYFNMQYNDLYCNNFRETIEIDNPSMLKKAVALSDHIMAQCIDGERIGDKFIRSNCLFGDIDNTSCKMSYTIDDFAFKFKKYEYYIATSKSHKKPKKGDIQPSDRFHFFLPLNRWIQNRDEYKGLLRAMSRLFFNPGVLDTNCIDAVRRFNANDKAIITYNQGESIYADIKAYIDSGTCVDLPDSLIPRKPVEEISNIEKRSYMHYLRIADENGEFEDYDNWIRLGAALHGAGFALADWKKLSWDDDKTIKLMEYKWKTFNDSAGLGSIIYICKEYGLGE